MQAPHITSLLYHLSLNFTYKMAADKRDEVTLHSHGFILCFLTCYLSTLLDRSKGYNFIQIFDETLILMYLSTSSHACYRYSVFSPIFYHMSQASLMFVQRAPRTVSNAVSIKIPCNSSSPLITDIFIQMSPLHLSKDKGKKCLQRSANTKRGHRHGFQLSTLNKKLAFFFFF